MSSIKKRLSYLFGALVMCMIVISSGSIIANAATTGTTSDGLKYSIEDGEAKITGYSGKSTSVVIPEKIKGYKVTDIGNSAFEGNMDLTSIDIPGTVRRIGDSAFSGCNNLVTINISKGATKIGEHAFSCCISLTSIDLPDTVREIGSFAFFHCEELISIDIPNGVKTIGEYAFKQCANLTTVNIADSVTSIGMNAFEECYSLKKVNIPLNVTVLDEATFSVCGALSDFIIPSNVTTLKGFVFVNCYRLKSVYVSDSVTDIDDNAFWGTSSDLVIKCSKGSAAEKYAKENGIEYLIVAPENYLGNYNATIKQTSFTYTGDYIKPAVTVKGKVNGKTVTLTKGQDYKVTYKNHKNSGTATITVTGIGDCDGTLTLSFKILPKKTTGFTYKTRTASTITLKWSKNASADGYVIQQCKGGKWTTIKTITSNSTVNYKVTGLKPSANYNFRIRAYKNSENAKLYSPSYTTKLFKTVPSTVKSFTFKTRTASTITLKWSKNASADGYVIQQYKGGKWTTIKTITKNSTVSYKVTGLKPSTSYMFRIKAYKKNGSSKLNGAYSTKTVKTLPSAVKGFTYKYRTANTITLKWTKNASADGYVIQQYKGGKWKTIKTITSKSTVNYKVAGLKKNTTYMFRVKAYKKSGSTKLYSEYTKNNIKTIE